MRREPGSVPQVTLHDVTCTGCDTEQDVEAAVEGDEAEWECAECKDMNVSYYDDAPLNGRGWF